MKNLGIPTTLGEFRQMTMQYPDETLLQFRNESRHELIEIEGELAFQETCRNSQSDPLCILREDIYTNDEINAKVGEMIRKQNNK